MKFLSFVSPAVTPSRKMSSSTVHSVQKLYNIFVKQKVNVVIMEEISSRKMRRYAGGKHDAVWITNVQQHYAYGHLVWWVKFGKHVIFAVRVGDFTGFYQCLKALDSSAELPSI